MQGARRCRRRPDASVPLLQDGLPQGPAGADRSGPVRDAHGRSEVVQVPVRARRGPDDDLDDHRLDNHLDDEHDNHQYDDDHRRGWLHDQQSVLARGAGLQQRHVRPVHRHNGLPLQWLGRYLFGRGLHLYGLGVLRIPRRAGQSPQRRHLCMRHDRHRLPGRPDMHPFGLHVRSHGPGRRGLRSR